MNLGNTLSLSQEVPSAIFFGLMSLAMGLFILYTYHKILKANASYPETIGTFTSGFLLLLLTYSPIISSRYVFNDDYYLWSWQQGMCHSHPEYLFALGIGRPMANLFLCPALSIVDTLEGANLVRLGCIFLTAITCFVINKFLIYLKFNTIFSYLIALSIVTSFAFQVYNSWLMATYIPIAVILGIFSIFIALKALELAEQHLGQSKLPTISATTKFSILCIISIIFYILTLATYQPSTGFFAGFAAIYLLRTKVIQLGYLRTRLITLGSIFCIANITYFVALKTFLSGFSYEDFPSSYNPNVLESVVDISFIGNRLIWFCQVPLIKAATILNVENIALSALFLVAVGGSLIILYLKDTEKLSRFKDSIWLFVGKYLTVTLCIPLSHLSILVSKNGDINYRTIAPLSTFCFITILLGLETLVMEFLSGFKSSRYSRKLIKNILLSSVLLFICSFNVLTAHSYLQTLSHYHSLEHLYLKEKLNSIPIEQLSRIMIITPKDDQIINNSHHDLNYFSSSNPDMIYSMIRSVFIESMKLEELKKIRIVLSHNRQRTLIQLGLTQDFNDIELLEDGYEEFNILKMDNYVYGLLQGEGEFSLERLWNQEYSTFFMGANENDVINKIDQYVDASDRIKKILADESYREFQDLKILRDEELIIDMTEINSSIEKL